MPPTRKKAKKDLSLPAPRRSKPAPEALPKSVMVLVYLTPEERALLDEICYYIGRNSQGRFRPSRTELIRRLVGRLRGTKKALKKVQTSEELDAVLSARLRRRGRSFQSTSA